MPPTGHQALRRATTAVPQPHGPIARTGAFIVLPALASDAIVIEASPAALCTAAAQRIRA